MKFIISEYAGFCPGVKRAIEIARNSPKPTVVLGALIHNKRVNQDLTKELIFSTSTFPKEKATSCVISAHGITKEYLESFVVLPIDGTCPKVEKLISISRSCKGTLIIIGDITHQEVKNVASYATNCIILSNKEQLENLKLEPSNEYTVLCQTTKSRDFFSDFSQVLVGKAKDVGAKIQVFDTLCELVEKRIEELKRYASDYPVIVVGDKESANCNTLFSIARQLNDKVYIAESINDVDCLEDCCYFITTASSAPIEHVKEIIDYYKEKYTDLQVF